MSIKVLVADDSITIQKVIGIIFGGDEYSLTIVDNGKAAVESAHETNPDILLIDALMPGMTGYEVSEAVRATPALAAKPILILTGSFEPFDEEKAKKCGADDFISKPFESQQIIAKVKELLELGRVRSQSAPASQAPVVSAPEFTIPAPEVVQQPAAIQPEAPAIQPEAPAIQPEAPAIQPEAPADIWGAFTTEAEPPAVEAVIPEPVPVVEASAPEAFEPDVFAIVSEEDDAQIIQTVQPVESIPQHTGSQWIPVEENTFEFEEIAEAPSQNSFTDTLPLVQEASFGDVAFEDEVEEPPAFTAPSAPEVDFTTPAFGDFATPSSTFSEPPVAVLEPALVMEASAAPPVASPVNLTEEQLRIAISGASRDVIERIVWEVVPDLAEALIRDAIRKIKEGL